MDWQHLHRPGSYSVYRLPLSLCLQSGLTLGAIPGRSGIYMQYMDQHLLHRPGSYLLYMDWYLLHRQGFILDTDSLCLCVSGQGDIGCSSWEIWSVHAVCRLTPPIQTWTVYGLAPLTQVREFSVCRLPVFVLVIRVGPYSLEVWALYKQYMDQHLLHRPDPYLLYVDWHFLHRWDCILCTDSLCLSLVIRVDTGCYCWEVWDIYIQYMDQHCLHRPGPYSPYMDRHLLRRPGLYSVYRRPLSLR